MNTKIFFIVGVIIVVMAGAALFLLGDMKQSDTGGNSSGLVVGKNAIYVAEQVPSRNVLVAVVHLEDLGFVVIHEDASGVPGTILGTSGLLAAGETKSPAAMILLSRVTKDGETIYAMLHLDDGDGVFDAEKDKPAKDSMGGEPVMMIVMVSADAVEPGVVNP